VTALDEALERALRVLKFQPDSPTALASAGSLLAATGRTTEALPLLQRSVELDPRQPEVLNNLGAVLRATGRLRDARSLFEQAVALSPGYADAVLNLAGARSAEGAHEAAVADLMRLLAEGHESAALLDQLGVALWKLGRYDEALAHLRRAAELDPTFADTFSHLGVVLAEYGNLEEARDAHLRAIDLAPNRPDFYRLLAKIDPDALDARRAAALEAMGENLSRVDRIERNFALALLAVRDGDRARAFAHYSAANAETRAMRAYDERRTLDQIREVEHMFTPAFMAPRRNMGDPSDVPVFVVGMPRSGTTLVEQILASHPDVGAAGELELFEQILKERDGVRELRDIGAAYVAALRTHAPGARRITDKMPANFQHAGFIHLALPNARMIHVRRDALDTCWSCFTQSFAGDGLSWAYDLGELGRYYRAYAELMEHWRRVLPPGALLEVRYEDLVGDFEAQARRIVAYCGLEWDARCLEFYKADRPVKTASVAQVRRPLYRSSIGASRPYLPYLAPLIEALGPELAG
jgi:Flp pilus assembly protein TadD